MYSKDRQKEESKELGSISSSKDLKSSFNHRGTIQGLINPDTLEFEQDMFFDNNRATLVINGVEELKQHHQENMFQQYEYVEN